MEETERVPPAEGDKQKCYKVFFFRYSFPDDSSKLLGIFETFSIWHNQGQNHFKALLGADICRLCAPAPATRDLEHCGQTAWREYEGSTLRHRMLYQAPFPPPPPIHMQWHCYFHFKTALLYKEKLANFLQGERTPFPPFPFNPCKPRLLSLVPAGAHTLNTWFVPVASPACFVHLWRRNRA